jgi:hypothetical protein
MDRQTLKNRLLPHTPMSEEQRKKKEQIERTEKRRKKIKANISKKESIVREWDKNINRYKEYLKHLENVIQKLTEMQQLKESQDSRNNAKISELRGESNRSLEKIKETLTEPIDQDNLNYHVHIHNWNSDGDDLRKSLLGNLGYRRTLESEGKWNWGSPLLRDIIKFKENNRVNPTMEQLDKEYENLSKSFFRLKTNLQRVEELLEKLKGNSDQGEGYIRIKVHKLI